MSDARLHRAHFVLHAGSITEDCVSGVADLNGHILCACKDVEDSNHRRIRTKQKQIGVLGLALERRGQLSHSRWLSAHRRLAINTPSKIGAARCARALRHGTTQTPTSHFHDFAQNYMMVLMDVAMIAKPSKLNMRAALVAFLVALSVSRMVQGCNLATTTGDACVR
jgi:hypothetical protein